MSTDPDQSQFEPETERETDSTAAVDLDWLTLDDGEEVLWASTPHKSSLVPALVIGIPLSFVLIGIPILISSYLNYTNTNYVVTSRGLYRKRGIFSRDVKQIGFDKVQNISYTQSAVGARLGYGTVEISTAGSSGVELQFQSIPTPAAIQELISREIERREDSGRDQEADADAVLDEILAELRGIRRALDANSRSASTGDTEAPAAIGRETVGSDPAAAEPTAVDQEPVESDGDDEGDDSEGGDGDDGEGDEGERDAEDPFEPAITEPADTDEP